MVKHNNQVPNIHCHKKYLGSSRGPIKVKLALDQATRKKARRIQRQAKAAKIAPRPLERLRPIVHCPTQKYSAKTKLGKGFTLEELKTAQLHPRYALQIGISIDWRRRNKSQESLDMNVQRLEEYKSKLVVLKKGSSSAAADASTPQYQGTMLPPAPPSKDIVMQAITQDMKDFKAYTTLRVAAKETKVEGHRIAVENRKKKE